MAAEEGRMRIIEEYGFSVTAGREEEHQRWLEANEQALVDASPEGTRYMGTFVTVYTSEKESGFYRTYWELDSYGAKDRMAAAARDESTDFGRLIREQAAFWATEWNAPWSQGLFKSAVDASVFDPPES
jgi:hypothetical protein